jgi:lipopolysaccharide cholinephosphotransferase
MNSADIKKIQNKLLEMGKSIADILEKHDIPYMIAYGTLLGAIRHKGFIPWDDDFDFYLFDDTYAQGIEYLRNELPADFFLEDEKSEPLYFHQWAHVKDLYSKAECSEFPQDSFYAHKGISIDLYFTKKMPLAEVDNYLISENEAYIKRRHNKNLIDEEDYIQRMAKLNEHKRIVQDNPSKSLEEVYGMVSTYNCHTMKIDDIFPLKRYSFEDTTFCGPCCGEKILTDIYGDYMKLPPIDKRVSHYNSVVWRHIERGAKRTVAGENRI